MSAEDAPLRIVFMGTPVFAADILEELAAQEDVICVCTRPDKVRSRGNKAQASPVKERAEALGLSVHCASSFRDPSEIRFLEELAPDVICVAAFGAILPKEVLDVPRLGCINVHASVLPRWRGAAPIERAILAGDAEAGVSIMRMEEGLDTGDFCAVRRIPVADMDAPGLTRELAHLGASALLSALSQMHQGRAHWTAQDESAVTYAEKIGKHELFLDPAEDAETNLRRVRASSAAHPAKCRIGDRTVTVLAAGAASGASRLDEGCARYDGGALLLGCAQGALEAAEVKPDGKRAMAGSAFAQGMPALKTGVGWSVL